MNDLRLFELWLQQPETVATLVVPASLVLLLVAGFPGLRPTFWRLAAIGLACVPVSHLLSYWDSQGYHVAPASLAVYLAMLKARRIDMRRDWAPMAAAIWLSTIVPDAIALCPEGTCGHPTWYWGIGGFGLKDGLVLYPVVFTSMFALLQGGWLKPSRYVEAWRKVAPSAPAGWTLS